MIVSEEKIVATTILEQLGGNRFIAMTGAKHFIVHDKGLSFHLPSRFAKNGINRINIKLNPMDTYDVTYGKWNQKSFEIIPVEKDEGCFVEDLRRRFTEVTGLDVTI